jgi:hypothetical protein
MKDSPVQDFQKKCFRIDVDTEPTTRGKSPFFRKQSVFTEYANVHQLRPPDLGVSQSSPLSLSVQGPWPTFSLPTLPGIVSQGYLLRV